MCACDPANAIAAARPRSAQVNADWRTGPWRQLADRFDGTSDSELLADRAAILLSDEDWVRGLLAPLIAALADDPWFEPAIRCSRDALRTGAVLLDTPTVTIAASVTDAAALADTPPRTTIIVPGRLSVTRYVRGGNARLRRWHTDAVTPDFSAVTAPSCEAQSPLVLHDGLVLRHDGRCEGHAIDNADSDIAALTVTIKTGAAPLMREYSITDGRFLRAACADDMASRMEMLLTFLRVSGRTDADEAFAAVSHHPAFHLRWAALREWLMLDVPGALPRLTQLADADPNAEVRAAAQATLAMLERRNARPCHA